jgi:hypothetical protein
LGGEAVVSCDSSSGVAVLSLAQGAVALGCAGVEVRTNTVEMPPPEDEGVSYLWLVGVAMEVCSAISGAIAKQLLRVRTRPGAHTHSTDGQRTHAHSAHR